MERRWLNVVVSLEVMVEGLVERELTDAELVEKVRQVVKEDGWMHISLPRVVADHNEGE